MGLVRIDVIVLHEWIFVGLRASVLAPDVQHEDGGDEQQGHDQNGNGSTETKNQQLRKGFFCHFVIILLYSFLSNNILFIST